MQKLDSMRKNRLLFYAIALLQGMVFYGSIATLYRESRGVSLLQIGVIEGIAYALMLGLEMPWGYVANRVGYKRTLLLCNALFFASKVVFYKADGFGMFLLERLMLSVVLSGLSGVDTGFLHECAGGVDTKKIFGIYEAMGTAGILVAALAFSLWIRTDFALSALLTAYAYGLAALLTLSLREPSYEKPSHPNALWTMAKSGLRSTRALLPYLFASALLMETSQFITVFMSQVQYRRSGIPLEWFGYLYCLLTLVGLAAAGSGRLCRRVGERRMVLLLFSAAAAACLLMSAFALPVLSVGCILLLRLASSLFAPIRMARQNAAIEGADRPFMLSLQSMAMSAVSVALNPVFGKAADMDVSRTMRLGAALCALGAGLMVWHGRKPGRG